MPNVHVCLHQCLGGGAAVSVYTLAHLLSVTGRRAGFVDLPPELRRSLSTADPVCARPARGGAATIRPTFLRHVSTGGGKKKQKTTTTSTSRLYAHQFVNTCKIY